MKHTHDKCLFFYEPSGSPYVWRAQQNVVGPLAMKNQDTLPTTYESAYAELQQILQELQNDAVSMDDLTTKIARANQLIRFCRERLRMTEEEVLKLSSDSN